jgi:5,10-methylenetetrahydromethanopterin reductase
LRSLSIAFQTDQPLSAYGPLASLVESYGFDAVSVYNDLLFQPAWLPLLEIARHTERIALGPAAVNPYTCHPINIAGNIALIDEASHGRAYLGLARGSWLDFLGLEPHNTPAALREAMECIRQLLSRSTQPYHGKFFSLAGGDSLRWPILRSDIPLLLGAWGEQTIHNCAHIISEVKVGGTTNPAAVQQIRQIIDKASVAAGRDTGSIGIAVGAVCVVDHDREMARALARRGAALYLPVIARLDSTLVIEPERLERIRSAAAAYDFEKAAGDIPDELLRIVAFAGTPDDITMQAAALFQAGATRIEFGTPHGLTEENGLHLLGERVLPALRQFRGQDDKSRRPF